MLADFFGVPMSTGEAVPWSSRLLQILAPVVEELQEFCRTQPANIDETGWRQERRRAWLWAVVTRAWSPSSTLLCREAARSRERGRRLPSRPEQ